jgi:predicted regulator of Ras-like GTPase activity (Roadblock/LC7/MglB family)
MRREDIPDFDELFANSRLDSGLEAVVLMKATGIIVAAWTRAPIPREILGVMAATMWGSLDTLVRTLGGSAPRSVIVEVDERRIVARPVPPSWMLLLVAPRSLRKSRLIRETERIAARLPLSHQEGPARPMPAALQE